jgi:uncharacterized membrane protein
MAFGDGLATLAGMRSKGARLPWNAEKSWTGTIVFFIAAAAGAFGLMVYTTYFRGPHFGIGWLAFLSIAVALSAAAVESMDMKLDDNLSVPLAAGLVLWVLHFAQVHPAPVIAGNVLPAAAAAIGVGLVSFALRAVDVWGLLGGIFIGFVIYYCAGWQGFLVLMSFFVLGTACTKVGGRVKEARGVAQEKKGRRGLKHALANCFAGLLFAYIFGCASLGESVGILKAGRFAGVEAQFYWLHIARAAAIAFAAAFAAAAADTVSSELGQVFGKKPVLITTFKAVPHGTNGGITLAGTAAGALASAAVAAIACAVGLVPAGLAWLPFAAGFVGMNIDSVLGAMMENKGLLNNEFVNLCCTASAALAAFAAVMLMFKFFSFPIF